MTIIMDRKVDIQPNNRNLRQFPLTMEDVNFPIYRYTKEKHVGSFFLQGEVRFGTLYSYHDIHRLGSAVGDIEEGVKFGTGIIEGSIPYWFYGNSINQWCLCLTKSMNRDFYREFGADCCVEISSEEYFVEIARSINRPILCGGLYNVIYEDPAVAAVRAIMDDASLHHYPLLLQYKPVTYAWQKEIRFCLEPWSPLAPRKQTALSDEYNDQIQRKYDRVGAHELAYSDSRNFPNLMPISTFAPHAIRHARIVERV